jgi:hypothetical protein
MDLVVRRKSSGDSKHTLIIQQNLFQQMHNLIFLQNKLGLHVSAYQAIIRAPITKNTENTASQNNHKKTLKLV